jgi:DNA-binding response OmpR family regulator
VDDESSVRDVLKVYLEREGYLVSTASTGTEAVKILSEKERQLTLAIIDIMLPEIDGMSLLRRIRVDGALPVILLSARTDEFDRVNGLELGADDYVPKPFSPREVVSRVKAVLRRGQGDSMVSNEKPINAGPITLNPNTRLITVRGQTLETTAREFDLLWFLARHPKQVFSREQLLNQVWGFSDFIDLSTVTVHIHRLREKIEENPAKPIHLITVWGVGYRFVAD